MPNEFISKGISSRVIVMENDSSKCKGYEVNIADNNKKNSLHHTIGSIDINKLGILSSYIYMDVNESRQNLY